MGFWTAPFEVADRSWIYEHHKDWLVHSADSAPIQIGIGDDAGREVLFRRWTPRIPTPQQYLPQYLRDTDAGVGSAVHQTRFHG